MRLRWWPAKVRQFSRYVTGRVSDAERAQLGELLTPPQLALFERMHRADQRHGLDVVAALRAAGHNEPELLLAGLLHDSGKGTDVHLWHRVGWSLAERYGDGFARLARRLPTFEHAFATLAVHAERSAELAVAAGCSRQTAELIRHQSDPNDPELGAALRLADEAS